MPEPADAKLGSNDAMMVASFAGKIISALCRVCAGDGTVERWRVAKARLGEPQMGEITVGFVRRYLLILGQFMVDEIRRIDPTCDQQQQNGTINP